ncbi:MAG: outer membrane beta-barrel protein, partial [Gammaproteobacteria bacterium]
GSDIDMELTAAGFVSSTSVDHTDMGYKVFGGYQFNPFIAVEGGYVDLGENSFTTVVTSAPVGFMTGTATGKYKTSDGFYLDAVGMVPIGERFSLLGRLGAYSMRVKLEVSGPAASLSDSSTDSDLHAGLGGAWHITDNWEARAEFDHFRKVGDPDVTGEADVDLWSLGLVFRF